ncbi:MAG: MFS transporter [Nitrosopumilaceae archaeon]
MVSENNSNKENPSGFRNVTALGVVSFFTDFSTAMVLGILPFFIVNTLGLSKALLGAIEGSSEFTSYAFRMVSGTLSDKLGKRKIFILAGYGLSTVSKPFFSIVSGWLDIFLVRNGDRIGKGLRTAPRDALIADSVSELKVGRAFGIHRTIDQMGAIVGPFAAFALLQVMDIRGIFLVSLIPGAVAVLVLIFFVKEIAIRKRANNTMLSNIGGVIRNNRPFVFLIIVTGIFSLGAFNFSFVLLKASDLGVEKNFIPLVYAIINVAHTAIGIPAGILSDKIGREKVLLISYGIFVISSILMIALSQNSLYAYVLATIFGLYLGISETVQRSVIPRYVSSDLRGTAFGIFNLVYGASFFVSNVVFGLLWDSYGLTSAVSYSMSMTLIAICGMFVLIKKHPISNLTGNSI